MSFGFVCKDTPWSGKRCYEIRGDIFTFRGFFTIFAHSLWPMEWPTTSSRTAVDGKTAEERRSLTAQKAVFRTAKDGLLLCKQTHAGMLSSGICQGPDEQHCKQNTLKTLQFCTRQRRPCRRGASTSERELETEAEVLRSGRVTARRKQRSVGLAVVIEAHRKQAREGVVGENDSLKAVLPLLAELVIELCRGRWRPACGKTGRGAG